MEAQGPVVLSELKCIVMARVGAGVKVYGKIIIDEIGLRGKILRG